MTTFLHALVDAAGWRSVGRIALAGAMLAAGHLPASAQTEPYIGQVATFAFSYCPEGWLEADGSLQSTSAYAALAALLSTTYGGNGSSTFGLPKLSAVTAPNTNATSKTMKVCIAATGIFPTQP